MKHDPVAEIVIHDDGERMGASWTMLKAGYELPAGRYALYTHPAPVQAQSEPDTCQMCGDKPYPGCNSEFQDEKTCRFWAAPVQHDMRLKNLQDSHNALAEAHGNVLKENAELEAAVAKARQAAPVQQGPTRSQKMRDAGFTRRQKGFNRREDRDEDALVQQNPAKDHEVAALVNRLRHIATVYHDHQSLRERIAQEIRPMFAAPTQHEEIDPDSRTISVYPVQQEGK